MVFLLFGLTAESNLPSQILLFVLTAESDLHSQIFSLQDYLVLATLIWNLQLCASMHRVFPNYMEATFTL